MASDAGGQPADLAPAGGIFGRFYEGLGYLAGLILAIMAGAVFLQVMLRYAGWASRHWMRWMLGGALAIIVVNAVGIAFFAYLIKVSFILVPNAQFQTSAGLGLPLGYVYAAVPVGSVLIILPMARVVFLSLRDLWPRPS